MKYKYSGFIMWIPVIVWMVIIFMFSAQNADTSTNTSSSSAELLAMLFRSLSGIISENQINILTENCQLIVRKLAHFSEYAVLGALSYNALRKHVFPNKKITPFISAVICLLYAASDELHQYFVPGRSCRISDILIDFSGAVFGIIMFILILSIINKRRSSNEANNML